MNQFLAGTTTDIFSIVEGSPVVGKTLAQLEIPSRSEASIITVIRAGKPYHDIGGDFTLKVGDMLVLLGNHKALDNAGRMLSPAPE